METRPNIYFSESNKLRFSLFEIQSFLAVQNKDEKTKQKYEEDLLIFGFLLGKNSNLHFKNINLDDFLLYIWDKILYINQLYNKKIINYRQKTSLCQVLIESQVNKINANLDKEINKINGNMPIRVFLYNFDYFLINLKKKGSN